MGLSQPEGAASPTIQSVSSVGGSTFGGIAYGVAVKANTFEESHGFAANQAKIHFNTGINIVFDGFDGCFQHVAV